MFTHVEVLAEVEQRKEFGKGVGGRGAEEGFAEKAAD